MIRDIAIRLIKKKFLNSSFYVGSYRFCRHYVVALLARPLPYQVAGVYRCCRVARLNCKRQIGRGGMCDHLTSDGWLAFSSPVGIRHSGRRSTTVLSFLCLASGLLPAQYHCGIGMIAFPIVLFFYGNSCLQIIHLPRFYCQRVILVGCLDSALSGIRGGRTKKATDPRNQ